MASLSHVLPKMLYVNWHVTRLILTLTLFNSRDGILLSCEGSFLLHVPLHSNNRCIHLDSCNEEILSFSHPPYRNSRAISCVYMDFEKTGESEDKQITWINDGNCGF